MPFECRQQVPKDCRASGTVNIFLRNTFMKCLKWHLTMSHMGGKACMHNKGMKIKF